MTQENGISRSARPLNAWLQLVRSYWWDSAPSVRLAAFVQLFAVISLQLIRSRASIALSGERRRQLDTMIKYGGQDRSTILHGLARYVASLVLLSPINKTYWLVLRSLRHRWIKHLTNHLMSHFIEAQCLSNYRPGEDPSLGTSSERSARMPDQRISTDVSTFVGISTMLSLDSLQSLINIYFSCWSKKENNTQ